MILRDGLKGRQDCSPSWAAVEDGTTGGWGSEEQRLGGSMGVMGERMTIELEVWGIFI